MKKEKDSGTAQGEKFKAAAREHGCEEDEKAFSEKMKKLASQRSPDSETE